MWCSCSQAKILGCLDALQENLELFSWLSWIFNIHENSMCFLIQILLSHTSTSFLPSLHSCCSLVETVVTVFGPTQLWTIKPRTCPNPFLVHNFSNVFYDRFFPPSKVWNLGKTRLNIPVFHGISWYFLHHLHLFWIYKVHGSLGWVAQPFFWSGNDVAQAFAEGSPGVVLTFFDPARLRGSTIHL